MMRALLLEQPGRPPSLTVREIPIPVPAAGEALVRVAVCGFCHHDLLVMAGVLRRGVHRGDLAGRPYPVLGHEISGVVAEVGAVVKTLRPGDPVASIQTNACGECDRCLQGREHRCRHGVGIGHGRDGGFAEYVVVGEASLVPVDLTALPFPGFRPQASSFGLDPVAGSLELPAPAQHQGVGVDLIGAALFGCPMGVVLQAAEHVAQLRANETVLVTGAGGGLGVHAVQVGAAQGARVLAVTSSPEKALHLAKLGAAEVVEIRRGYPHLNPPPQGEEMKSLSSRGEGQDEGQTPLDFSEVAMALTGDQGVDVILDTVGSPLFPSTWRSLGQYGRLVQLGEVTGRPVALNLAEVIFRDARILGSSGASRQSLRQVASLVAQGRLRPVVSRVLPLEAAPLAFDLLASRSILGRLLLKPSGD